MNHIFRLLKCGCYAFKLPFCKQLHGNGFPLTTTSPIIELTIIDEIPKELQRGEYAHSQRLHVATRRTFFSRT